MKDNPAGPGGPLTGKPTWWNAPGCSQRRLFFAYVDTSRRSGPSPRRWLPIVQQFLSAVRSAELGPPRIPHIGSRTSALLTWVVENHDDAGFSRRTDAGP